MVAFGNILLVVSPMEMMEHIGKKHLEKFICRERESTAGGAGEK